MRELGVELELEDDSSRFMGVNLDQDLKIGLLYMKHTGIIQRVIEAVGMDYVMPKGNFTPSEVNPLVKDDNGEPMSGLFSYIGFLGMLLYMSGNTHKDVFFLLIYVPGTFLILNALTYWH